MWFPDFNTSFFINCSFQNFEKVGHSLQGRLEESRPALTPLCGTPAAELTVFATTSAAVHRPGAASDAARERTRVSWRPAPAADDAHNTADDAVRPGEAASHRRRHIGERTARIRYLQAIRPVGGPCL